MYERSSEQKECMCIPLSEGRTTMHIRLGIPYPCCLYMQQLKHLPG